jgi:hypothetical protein
LTGRREGFELLIPARSRFPFARVMLKLLHIVLHDPRVGLLVIVTALFVLALILNGLNYRRLERELFAARLRARTQYQRRRLQNGQWERESFQPKSNLGFLPENRRRLPKIK